MADGEPHMLAAVNFTSPDMLGLTPDMNVVANDNEALVADLLAEASTHTGTRYRRGAKGPKAFDCSGFTSYVYRQFGYSLSASSRTQYTQGEAVAIEDIMPGDLVFFKGRRSSQVGHVGIAIEYNPVTGVTTFIHAAVSGGIRVDSTDQRYYRDRFLGARRVIL